jgi:lysophospholipase L1-like esterase
MERIDAAVEEALKECTNVDISSLQKTYYEQDEFIYIENFLPASFVNEYLAPAAQNCKQYINRNYIPTHKVMTFLVSTNLRRKEALFRHLF